MANQELGDREAKKILLGWPQRTKKLWPVRDDKDYWLRCQPKAGSETAPRLTAPGASLFKSQPDGLWAYFANLNYCDLVAIEVCGSIQNLNDKRSRYALSGHSTLLTCPHRWFTEAIDVPHGGKLERWKACGTIVSMPKGDVRVPVRYLRVLYAVRNVDYKRWTPEHIPSGHEFFCRHSSLGSYNASKMQEFLRRMSIHSHFYTTTNTCKAVGK